MTFAEYQSFAKQGIHPETVKREPIIAFALGLVGETGEVIDDIKKRIYHGRLVPLQHTVEELGDVLWYVANIATELGVSLDKVIQMNVEKLERRYADLYVPQNWQDNTDSHESIIKYGMYQGKKVVFTISGPHIKMYEHLTNKFIKFLNKEEKKYYGFAESSTTGKPDERRDAESDGCDDRPPWD